MATDAAGFVLETLQNDTDFTNLVTGGNTNVLETGSMRTKTLSAAEETRRAAANDLVLGVSVQDAGEVPHKGLITRQTVIVRVLDRQNGFDAIRTTREAAMALLSGKAGPLDTGGIVSVLYGGRTGHRVDRTYLFDFESITFTAYVDKEV